jgi:pilus assembly protein TadC
MGNPGTALANMLKSPAVRRMAWQAVQSGASGLGKFGPLLQRAASMGGAKLAEALHEALLKTDPEYQAKVGALMESGGTQ